jgi:hypothetical protein
MPANRGPAWSGVRRRHALPTAPGTEDTQQHAHYHARMSSAAHHGVSHSYQRLGHGLSAASAARAAFTWVGADVLQSSGASAAIAALAIAERQRR